MHWVCFVLLTNLAGVPGAFYVATGGSDTTGDGSNGNPWATITMALDSVPDGALILVKPGTYEGRVRLRNQFATGVTVQSEVPYQARLRHTETVVTCYDGKGITMEGFDIAHTGPGAGGLVIQVQDLIGEPGGTDAVSRIVFRNNVLHDSYNNDILKINNGASDVVVEGNIFYNQSGSDEHIDINSVARVVVQDNILFNDFAGSGRVNGNDTSGFIVVKDSNAGDDTYLGAEDITIRRNVFLNWEGSTGSNFLLLGEDGQSFFECRDVQVENNLFLGNSGNVMRASFGVKGCRDVLFVNNTVSGDLPALAFAMRINVEGQNMASENITFANNVWSDPTGTMGSTGGGNGNDFSDTPPGEVGSFVLDTNLYWNGGAAIPEDAGETINPSDDGNAVFGDPGLPSPAGLVLPRWVQANGAFADGSTTIRDAFVNLVSNYGTPSASGPATGAARPDLAPATDILGRVRNASPEMGAVEVDGGTVDADTNDDGFVDAVDVQRVINAVLGTLLDERTDVNGDGQYNALDVQTVINAALGVA